VIDQLFQIEQRAREFGNHFHKYLMIIKQNHDDLVSQLESRQVLDKVMLYKPANDLAYEMDTIAGLTTERTKQLDFLATYYAFQYLILNIRCIDILRMSILSGNQNLVAYMNFMKLEGDGFRKLTACYMERVLGLFATVEELGDFVVLGVGTRADQDDIDIGIIDDGDHHRAKLNLGMGKVVREMMKRACYLHLHISEHVGTESYSASIDEYNHLLDKEIHDFVIINEMLNAWPIFGSWDLFSQFQQKVISRYYSDHEDLLYHEGFLRGILGEILSLRIVPLKDDRLHPKDDALRMIKGMLSVAKLILGIKQIGNWQVLSLLKERSPWSAQFTHLEESLIFIETFRFLYQLFICQSEDIFLQDRNDWRNLNYVAQNMGFRNMGVIKAWNQLLVAYHQYVNQANQAVDVLLPWVREHLSKKSRLSGLFGLLQTRSPDHPVSDLPSRGPEQQDQDLTELVRTFADQILFFRGTTFWDDILETLSADDGVLLHRLVRGIQQLPPPERRHILGRFAQCGHYSTLSIITILTFWAGKKNQWQSEELFREFSYLFLKVLHELPNADERLIRIFTYKATLLNDFFQTLPDDYIGLLDGVLTTRHWDDKIEIRKNRLLRLLYFQKVSSHHFHRFLEKMTKRNPECIRFLDKTDKIQMVSAGLLGKIEETESFSMKKELLGDYYDLEYVRVGILTLLGDPNQITSAQYTLFVDNYLQTLFNICKQELDFQLGKKTFTQDLLAVFSAGGHAREQAFDNDYDIIVLLNSADQSMLEYSMRIVSRMNSEIIKRGTLPHYRFADHFGTYVTTFSELKKYLSSNPDNVFIDKSQLLGCRRVVGSQIFSESFMNEIIIPHVFEQKKTFIKDMAEEYLLRHEKTVEIDDLEYCIDVKDCHGGLRDIEMLLMVYKASFNIRKNISTALFEMLLKADSVNVAELKTLERTYNLLVQIRDFYRLTVTADDSIIWDELNRPIDMLERARIRHPIADTDKIRRRILKATNRSAQIIDRLMLEFQAKE